MNGFAGKAFQVVISPGVTTDLGTIRLEMSFLMTLAGKITDASTGAPIPGAEVTLSGGNFTGRADFAGTYAIADIPNPGEYTVKYSAAGYVGKSFTMGSSPWLQTMDIALSPRITTGGLTGTVVDFATNQPLAGVALTLKNDPAVSATTDSSGVFTLNTVPPGPQQVSLALSGYNTRILTTSITVGAVSNVEKLTLAATELPASIQGTVWDAIANAPFAEVTIQAIGTPTLQTVTSAAGTYQLDNVTPGTVTVAATALSKPGYYGARFRGTLEPGGILVYNPTLSTVMPGTIGLTLQTDKAVYRTGDTVSIAINLKNSESEAIATALHVRVTDPSGANAYETSVNVNLDADGATDRALSFALPASAQWGSYTVLAEVYDANGAMVGITSKNFGVTVSQIAITPVLPAVFAAGANTLSFSLANTGTLAVSAGTLSVTLKDPAGTIVSTVVQNFSLALGENKTITATLPIPALKFGTYTLSYVQSDETKTGQVTDIPLPNTLAVSALYDDTSHRIREKANLTVTLRNTGRFNLDTGSTSQTIALMVEVPDAAYTEIKTLFPAPVAGSAAGSVMLYQFTIPETMNPGQHGTRITVTLPSGSTTVQTAQLAIMESSLSLSPIQTAYTAGDTIHPVFANGGGVDTQVQYRLSLYDAKAALIAENTIASTVVAGSSMFLSLPVPTGAVDGSYNLVINYKDTKTGKEATVPNDITINGVKGTLQVQTDKQNYLLPESIAGFSSMTSSGTPLTGGNLHLQVTTGPGEQKMKTWTTQADFQTGVRNGVDTYGVNDWIIPDDDFSGTAIDTNKWSIGGNVSIQSGRLFADTMQTPVRSGISSKWLLEGDFDIQVDFMSNNSTQYTGAGFAINIDNSWIGIGNYTALGYASQVAINGVQQSYPHAGPSSNSGQFRITRTSNTIVAYYWDGTSWIAVNNVTSSILANPCYVQMSIYRDPSLAGATAAFDNFKVNSGRIKTENQTVDSVRLLPLNDNFDDGVLNLDRWRFNGTAPTEAAGVLHMTSNAASTWNTVQLRASLPGDFNAVSNYKNFFTTPFVAHNGSLYFLAYTETTEFYINRASDDLSRASGQFVVGLGYANNYTIMGTEAPYSSQSGSLRLRRVGNTGYDEYWDGTKWVTVFSDNRMSLTPSGIEFVAESAWNKPNTQVDIDSFYTNKGTYTNTGIITLKYDSGTSGNKWDKLLYSSDQPVGTSIKFRTHTAETETGLTTSTWSDYLTSSGSSVTSPAAQWIEIEATLATTDTNITPLLHDVTVTYEGTPGGILWQTEVPTNLAQGTVSQLSHTIGTLAMTGKFYLEGTLTSSTGQTVVTAEYPFYVEQGNIQISLSPDKKIYRPGDTVTITGEIKNLSSIAATGLSAQVQGTGVATPYIDTFDLPANSTHPFSLTTMAGSAGIYQLMGLVTQNLATLADISDQYEVASPALIVTLTAPDTAANEPFTIAVSLNNSGKVSATTTVHVVDDRGTVVGDQNVTLAAGESKILQYTRQITGATTYSANMSGDLVQTLTKKVAYFVAATDSSLSGHIVTDKMSYNPNEQVTLTTTVSASSMRENLSTLVTITNSQGQAVYSATAAIPTLIQGQIVTSRNYWKTTTFPAGNYLVSLQILDGTRVLSSSTSGFSLIGSATTGGGLTGTVAAQPNVVETGNNATLAYTITNQGNQDLAALSLSLIIVDPATSQLLKTIDAGSGLSLVMNGSKTGSVSFATTGIAPKTLLAILQYSFLGTIKSLASAPFTVTDTTLPVLTVSTLANGSYTRNETLNVAGTVTDNIGIKDLQVNGISVPVLADNSFSQALLLKSGPNTVKVVATDLANNQSSDNRIINLDQIAPQLAITSPVDNSKTRLASLDVTGTVDDATSTVVATLDRIVQPVTKTGNGFTFSVALVPGINTIEVTATDPAINTSSLKRTITYDDQKPSLAITDPGQDFRTNQGSLTIRGTVSDPYTAVSVAVSMDGQTFNPTVTNGSFEQTVSFNAEKSYAIVVTATNEVGSTSSSQRNIIYDITPPALTLTQIASPTNQPSQVIGGTMEAGASITAQCSTAAVGAIEHPTSTTWSATLSGLTIGSNPVSVFAFDVTSNMSTVTAQIIYDTQPPTGTIAINAGTTITNSTQVMLSLSATDANGISKMRFSNDGSAWSDPENFATSRGWYLASGDGSKRVSVSYQDTAGNWSVPVSADIILDTISPIVSASPAGGIFNASQSVKLTASEISVIRYTTDGSMPTTNSAVYHTPISVIATTTLHFMAVDSAGNHSDVKTESFIIDTIPPALTVSTLANGAYTNNQVLNIAGTATDASGISSLTINGVGAQLHQDGSFSQALVLQPGSNAVTVVATDLADNSITDARTIILDMTVPQITITAPADNTKTATSVMAVTGTVSETSTVTVKLGSNTQNAVMNGTDFSASVNLAPGINTIEVTATDPANNAGAQKRTAVYDNQKPSLTITDPPQDIRTNQSGLILKGSVSDIYTQVNVTVTMDGKSYAPPVVNNSFQLALTFPQEKSYTIVVTATNEAGSSTTTQRNVIYDVTPPALSINPVTSPTTANSQTVSGTRESGLDVTVSCSTATIGVVSYPTATTWQVSVTSLKSGSNIITGSSTDAANNVATVSKEIIYAVSTLSGNFSSAVFGNAKVSMSGGSYTDSYVGNPAAWFRGQHSNGDIGTNSLQACGIQITGGIQVIGKAWVGHGGNSISGECVTGGSSITGGGGTLAVAKDMTPKVDPCGGTALGALKLTGGASRTLASGEYRVTSLDLSGGTTLTLNGPITLHNDGNFMLAGGAKIVITTGPVIVYQNGQKIDISNGVIANNSQTPKNFTIYGTSGLKTINLTGGTNVHALIYAPNAIIKISGGQNTFGSVIGNTVDISGGSSVHYDESLRN